MNKQDEEYDWMSLRQGETAWFYRETDVWLEGNEEIQNHSH